MHTYSSTVFKKVFWISARTRSEFIGCCSMSFEIIPLLMSGGLKIDKKTTLIFFLLKITERT